MSTNNFKFDNILVVIPDFKFDNRCLDEECPHYEKEGNNCEHVDTYYEFDTEGYNMYIDDLKEQFEKIGFENCDISENDRSYSGIIISCWSLIDSHDNTIAEINIVIRNGYYDGSNIDYLYTEHADLSKTSQKIVDTKINKVEKILRANGTELLKVGQFSNGEAIYKLKK